MQVDILNLDGKSVGKIDLQDGIFGIDPRADILHRVVTWQRANARAGTHAVKARSAGGTRRARARQRSRGCGIPSPRCARRARFSVLCKPDCGLHP